MKSVSYLIFLALFFGQKAAAQYPEFIIKEIHSQLELVPEEETHKQGGYTFKQKGYKSNDMSAHFTSAMLWIQAIRSYPWTEKAHLKFLQELQKDTFTEFVKNFAWDTRNKQLEGMDKKKYQHIEMGNPQTVTMLNYRGIRFDYTFINTDSKLLNSSKKNRFKGHRVLLFMDKYIAEITWEYVSDEHQWNKIILEQILLLTIK